MVLAAAISLAGAISIGELRKELHQRRHRERNPHTRFWITIFYLVMAIFLATLFLSVAYVISRGDMTGPVFIFIIALLFWR